jgi:uncharacterized protein
MKIRKWLRILHRDIGYVAAGLTIVYTISGIAVNHRADWNPNYAVEKKISSIDLNGLDINNQEQYVKSVLYKMNETGKLKNAFFPDSSTLQIFTEGNTIVVDLNKHIVTQEKIKSRAVIRQSNFLHLNAPKRAWTYVADLFAVSLAFLAISGLFLIKGKKGITGRGAWLTALGVLIPIIFWLLYY